MGKFIFLDTETGGLDPKTNPLLAVGAVAVDTSTGEPVREFYVELKPVPGFEITPAALRVNKLDVDELEQYGWHWKDAACALADFLGSFPDKLSDLQLVCWNANFDLSFVREWLLPDLATGQGASLVHFRVLDVMIINDFLYRAGVSPKKGSLSKVAEAFKIDVSKAHHALEDAHLAYQVYAELLKLTRRLVDQ